MRKVFVFIVGLFMVGTVFAVGENVPTSKSYVDSAIVQKQDTIPANAGTAQVLTNTGVAGEYGTKNIYDSSADYAGQTDALVTADTMNAAVQNAIETEFKCISWVDDDPTKECLLLEIRNAPMLSTLPAGYTQLEYIESTGTQAMDTGIRLTSDTVSIKLSAIVEFLDTKTTYANGSRYFCVSLPNAGVQIYTNFDYIFNQYKRISISLNTRYHIETETRYNFRSLTVNGIKNVYDNTFQRSITDDTPLYLFANDVYAGYDAGAKVKLYKFEIYKNDTILRNFIPARRNSDGEIGMYDTVTNAFFTNSGYDAFIAGPVFSYLPQN